MIDATVLLAKSRNGSAGQVTLATHTAHVLAATASLFGVPDAPSALARSWCVFFGVNDVTIFVRDARASAFCHDWGKANDGFQRMLARRGEQLLRHEQVSAILMCWPSIWRWLAAGEFDVPLLLSAVVGHHLKARDVDLGATQAEPDQGLRLRWDDADFHAYLAAIAPTLGLAPTIPDDVPTHCAFDGERGAADLQSLVDAVFERLDAFDREIRADEPRRRLLWAVRAALIAADAAGSGLVRTQRDVGAWIDQCLRFDDPTASPDGRMTGETIRRRIIDERMRARDIGEADLNPFQRACDDAAQVPARALLLAPCGSGKTLAAWRWIAARLDEQPRGRAIFLYPTRGTATEGYKDYAGLAGDDVAALVHGTADLDLDGIESAAADPRDTAEQRADEARLFALRQWPKRLFSATVDQFLAFLQHGYAATCQLPLLVDSVLVLDEVHSYDRGMWSALVEFLKTFPNVPVLCMTATLLDKRVKDLCKPVAEGGCGLAYRNGLDFDNKGSALALAANFPRYRVQRVADQPAAGDIVREALRAGRRVLWVVNTVDRCQAIAREFADDVDADVLMTAGGLPLFCYHSRFKLDDRKRWHERVVAAFKPGNAAGGVLAVTTQVCEMSLDLDAELLVTELCPATALVQRMGRCCRDQHAHATGRPPGDVVIYAPEHALPYAKPDLAGVDAIVEQMVGRDVSQEALAELLETVAPPVELAKACRFTQSGAWAAAGEEQFRDANDLSRPALLPGDVPEYIRLRDPRKQRQGDRPWHAEALVLNLPKADVQRDTTPGLPQWMFMAKNGDAYHATLGYCSKALPKHAIV